MAANYQCINNDQSVVEQPSFDPLENSKLPEQLFRGMEKPHQSQFPPASPQTKSTNDSNASSFNEKTNEIMQMENNHRFDVQAGRVYNDSESTILVTTSLGTQENSSSTPTTAERGPSKRQSPYKNIYKAIYRELLSYLPEFCNPDSAPFEKIRQEVTRLEKGCSADPENTPLYTQLKNHKPFESQKQLVEWLELNKSELKEAIGNKRFAKFMPLTRLIQDSNGLINAAHCRKYFEEVKGHSVKNLKGEGKILTWLLIVAFSLVWLGEEDALQFLPLQKDTVALFYWIINSQTGADTKCLLLNSDNRKHIRKILETNFLDLFESAWSQFPDRHAWLANLAHVDPCLEKVIAKSVPSSTACSEAFSPFSPLEEQVQENFNYEEFAQQQLASLSQYEKITCEATGLDYKLIVDFDEEILTPQKLIPMTSFESFEDIYFQNVFGAIRSDSGALSDRVEEGWSQDTGNWFAQFDQVPGLHEWKLQQILNGNRPNAEFDEDEFELRKKVKTA